MLRLAPLAALALLAACAPDTPPRTYGPQPNARPALGVLVNATRGRCVWVLTRGQPERVCVPRKRRPEPRDSIGTDTMSAPAPVAR
jgi:hypothetical protein